MATTPLHGAPAQVPPSGAAVKRPRKWGYAIAISLVLGGFALALGLGLGGGQTNTNQAEGFDRVTVPGTLVLHVAEPATYYVYSEGTACAGSPDCHGQIYPVTVRVTGPAGRPVSVDRTSGPTYMIGGSEGSGVARFDATSPGSYRVAVSTGPYSEGMVAVGKAFPTWTEDWVAWLAMAALCAGGVLIIVLPIARHRR